MASSITIKLSPGQFDHLRDFLKEIEDRHQTISQDQSIDRPARHNAASRSATAHLLLDYINRA